MSISKNKDDDHAPGQNKEHKIIVNGREKTFVGKEISFTEVVELAFGTTGDVNTIYTVTYSKGEHHKPKGTLVKGESTKVKDGMIFNVTATSKS